MGKLQESIEKQLGVKVSHLYIKVYFDEDSGIPSNETLDGLPDQIVIEGETFNFGFGSIDRSPEYSYAEWNYDNAPETTTGDNIS